MLNLFILLASAQEAANVAPEKPSIFESLIIPLAAFFLIFYFLVLRPQASKIKETQSFLSTLKKGDEVLTTGGILGTIVGITESFVDLKISEDGKIKVQKTAIAGPFKPVTEKKS